MKCWLDMPREEFFEIAKIIDKRYKKTDFEEFCCGRYYGYNFLYSGYGCKVDTIRIYSNVIAFTQIDVSMNQMSRYKSLDEKILAKVDKFLKDNGYGTKLIKI